MLAHPARIKNDSAIRKTPDLFDDNLIHHTSFFVTLLKNTHLRRRPHPSSLQRTSKYASLLRILDSLHLGIFEQPDKSKYPPAEPGALRLLAPQRGLIAIGSKSKPNTHRSVYGKFFCCRYSCESRNPVSSGFRVAFHLPGMTILLPKMSNCASPPAEPGVYLDANYFSGTPVAGSTLVFFKSEIFFFLEVSGTSLKSDSFSVFPPNPFHAITLTVPGVVPSSYKLLSQFLTIQR